ELKCPYGQGYYFFRPMNAVRIGELLTQTASAKKVRISRIRSFDLFAGLPEEQLEEIAENCREMDVPGGTVLIEQGQPSDEVYLLERGSVGIHRKIGGTSQFLGVLEAPSFFGEQEILSPGKSWNARVKAMMDLHMLTLPLGYCSSLAGRSSELKSNLKLLLA